MRNNNEINDWLESFKYWLVNETVTFEWLEISEKITIEAVWNWIQNLEPMDESRIFNKWKLQIEEGELIKKDDEWSLIIKSWSVGWDWRILNNIKLTYIPSNKEAFSNEEEWISIKNLEITLDWVRRIFWPKKLKEKAWYSKANMLATWVAALAIWIVWWNKMDEWSIDEFTDSLLSKSNNTASLIVDKASWVYEYNNSNSKAIDKVGKNYYLIHMIQNNFPDKSSSDIESIIIKSIPKDIISTQQVWDSLVETSTWYYFKSWWKTYRLFWLEK